MGLLTTTVGWFPKPVELRRARWRFTAGEIDEDVLRAAEVQASRAALQLQEQVGLDLWSDGQMERSDPATFFAERLEGLEVAGLVRCFGNRYYKKPRVVDAVRRTGALTVDTWRAAQAGAAKPVKAILTGPYTLMDWCFDEHYDSRESCCMAFAEALGEEAEALVAAGAREIEFDERAISSRPGEMGLASRALARVTGPLRGRARTWAHLGYGDLLPVLDQVFELPVDGLLLELVNSGCAVLPRLDRLPADKFLGAGVVEVHSNVVESEELVRGRVAELLRRVPPDRLWLMPDGGLRALDPQALLAKLRLVVRAAAAV
jgi:5-methyltetrahydropteroyltriglutamate--homocysteine methyltransferase